MSKEMKNERDDRKVAGGCIPVRRKIASGGKEGSYADARTGGKQAYLALKKAKPPGSAGGWTKKNCICCHKCKNDRSAPNGFVCMNPAHLYWGSKADNTYDQNRGNGWAAENKKSLEENTYLKGDSVMKISRVALRKLIKETFDQMTDDPYAMDPNVQQSGPINPENSPWMYDSEPALRGPSSAGQKPAQQPDEKLIDQFLLDIADVYKLGHDQAGFFAMEAKEKVKEVLKAALEAASGAADDMGEF